MITTKQRAFLRARANGLEPVGQIGKNGIGPLVLETVSAALEAHELIKLTVLEACPLTAREAAGRLCEALECDPVQTIGRKIVLYRPSSESAEARAKKGRETILLPR